MQVVVASHQPHLRQHLRTVQFDLLLGDRYLVLQDGIFRAVDDLLPVFYAGNLWQLVGNHYHTMQWVADSMAEIHRGEAQGILRLLAIERALVPFHLYLQHIVAHLHAVPFGALHVLEQLIEEGLVVFCHQFHLPGFHH